jgi:hypothetical protein
MVKGGIEVRKVPGDHHSCIREHVGSMAGALGACLERSVTS